jgi:hypothetical protein
MGKTGITLLAVLLVLSRKLWGFLKKLVRWLLVLAGVAHLLAVIIYPRFREGPLWEETIKSIGFFGSLITLTIVELLVFRKGGKVQVPKWFTIAEVIIIFVATFVAVMISGEVRNKRLQEEMHTYGLVLNNTQKEWERERRLMEEAFLEGEKERERRYEMERHKKQ